jgi:hypothetical protein
MIEIETAELDEDNSLTRTSNQSTAHIEGMVSLIRFMRANGLVFAEQDAILVQRNEAYVPIVAAHVTSICSRCRGELCEMWRYAHQMTLDLRDVDDRATVALVSYAICDDCADHWEQQLSDLGLVA